MSRKANVLSDSKIFIDGISPVTLVSFPKAHACGLGIGCNYVPLMILQKMHAAIVVLSIRNVWLASHENVVRRASVGAMGS